RESDGDGGREGERAAVAQGEGPGRRRHVRLPRAGQDLRVRPRGGGEHHHRPRRRRGSVGHPDQGHPQGSDLTHLRHGDPQARGQLRLPGHRGQRLWLRLAESALPVHICPEGGALLRGVVVPGGGGARRPHFHPAPGLHPHHPRTEQ
ncbi:hypothetical protein CRUP_016589, partial [Coryphaenoides rupestris]